MLAKDGSHLVIGATGHIGPYLIQQLADMGAGTVVAVSRNPGDKLKDLGRQLASSGTTLVEVAADVTDENAMTALFDRFGTDLPALEGIYLAAFAGGPVTLADMTDDDVNTMFRPKLDALGVLHALSLRTNVRHFVLFSSISGLLGSRWLAHYTATSAFLDTFAYGRRNMGLPATVVNWGLWKSLSDQQTDAGEVMANAGLEPMPDEVAIRALPLVMGSDAPVRTTVVDADWPLLAAAIAPAERCASSTTCWPGRKPPDGEAPESEFRKELRECAPEGRRELLASHIVTMASAVIGLSPDQSLDPEAGFFQLGMDSLMSVTLQRRLSASLGIALPAALIYEYPTISSLPTRCASAWVMRQRTRPRRRLAPASAPALSNAPGPARERGEQTERTCGVSTDNGYDSASNELPPNAIAVIGMAGNFPGADSLSQFWENLSRGEESVTTLSEEALTAAGVSAKTLEDPAYVRRAAMLNGIEEFDAEYFGITPYTARMMDPQQRLFLQTAWHAIEDSGYDPANYDGAIGVFASSTASGYLMDNIMSHRDTKKMVGEGVTVEMFNLVLLNDKDYLATRVSHKLNLRGPSLTVQTACSSSLVAVHLACQSLLSGECDMALAGGVGDPGAAPGRLPLRAGGDRVAVGPLPAVRRRGRRHHLRQRRGGGGPQAAGGRARRRRPHPRRHPRLGDQQRRLDEDDLHRARRSPARPRSSPRRTPSPDVDAATIGYVETHGTGTPLGDPIEIEALPTGFRGLRARAARPVRAGLGEVQHRPPRRGGRRRRAYQDRPGA